MVLLVKLRRAMKTAGQFISIPILFLYLVLAFVITCSPTLANDVAVIEIKFHWASELAPIVQSMLSPEGKVTVSERVNSLVVVDTRDALQRIRHYIQEVDRPQELVRIRVRFHQKQADVAGEVKVRGRISDGDVRVATGGTKQDGVDISIEDRHRDQTSYSEYFVVTTSGNPAYIIAGTEIPYSEHWPSYHRRYATTADTLIFQTVESGFEVTPTVVGNNVHLRIVPRIAYDDNQESVVRFFGAQTELMMPFGTWVEIGGTADQNNEVLNEILSRREADQRMSRTMSLLVEKP